MWREPTVAKILICGLGEDAGLQGNVAHGDTGAFEGENDEGGYEITNKNGTQREGITSRGT